MSGKTVSIGDIEAGGSRLLLIAGPCQIESLDHCLMVAERVAAACHGKPIDFVFKSSFDKANRTSIKGDRGPGPEEGLQVLRAVREALGIPVITDIHLPEQAVQAAEVVDILQIPAFLCRQTDLLTTAARTGRPLLVKKGQFLHPSDMQHVAEKVRSAGNNRILLCERGTCFGYRDLVVDMRSLLLMKQTGCPVVFDATHSVQSMGGSGGSSGGSREFIEPLTRAAVAAGVDGLFLECHDRPEKAPSDGASMLPLDRVEPLLRQVTTLIEARSRYNCWLANHEQR